MDNGWLINHWNSPMELINVGMNGHSMIPGRFLEMLPQAHENAMRRSSNLKKKWHHQPINV
jgi:hypothetical protein